MMSLFLAQFGETAPDTKGLMMVAILPTLIGAVIFFLLNKRDKGDLGFKLRLLALVPILIGVIWGAFLSYKMATDYVYQQMHLIGAKKAALHYAVLGVNLAGAAGVLIWNARSSKGPKYDF